MAGDFFNFLLTCILIMSMYYFRNEKNVTIGKKPHLHLPSSLWSEHSVPQPLLLGQKSNCPVVNCLGMHFLSRGMLFQGESVSNSHETFVEVQVL